MANSARRVLAPALASALSFAACGAIGGSGANATFCPPAALESVTVEARTVVPVTYAVLIDRAYTGDSKRSASYPWPQLPRTALETVAAALPKLDLRAGDAVVGAWISHNSNDTSEIFLPFSQVKRASTPELPVAPTPPKPPVNKLECNEYAANVQSFNDAARAWRAKVHELQQRASDEDQRNVTTFISATSAAIRGAAPAQDPVGTDIFGSLAVASGVFAANPGSHRLLVFSDMTDTIGNPVRPDLAQSEVVVALYHRDDANDQGRGQKDWDAMFRSLGARAPVFLAWAATTPDKLAEQLKGAVR
ncbi:MAG: hypothetical protein E6I57_00850 [Chloroflexi bacterium]|nr:MAG: hypothetical protein E6J49_12040 [Chloroflexota bacterium]TMB75325.1 MAG: hypothetical protein E6J52_09655 [Chloroflexota bacterium]TMB94562.1 MAG: hypothetical protein E6J38_07640 [Chloroflexota bacterium]TMC27547.1 MAG: hypothetical protein E6J27_10720 [Chloroflexota bacterium]TMC32627.1 MAG: hypothetical protein E6J24_13125 [Chloroflexota bacterium]